MKKRPYLNLGGLTSVSRTNVNVGKYKIPRFSWHVKTQLKGGFLLNPMTMKVTIVKTKEKPDTSHLVKIWLEEFLKQQGIEQK